MDNTLLLNDDRLTRDEAQARAELVTIDTYEIELDLANAMQLDEPTYGVTTTLRFRAQPGATTFLNYLGHSVDDIVLNGKPLDTALVAGTARIMLPHLAAKNEVTIRSRSWYSHSGEGLHRFLDPADGQVYLYTQFEPADARRVYPNMEQPDLKAVFNISMIGPPNWVLASNGAERQREQLNAGTDRVRFEPTQPVSTYLTTFLAGPYAQYSDEWQGHTTTGAKPISLRIFARQSLTDHVDTNELFSITKRGLTWFHEQFQYPYPWGKYDQAFVPEYNLGAMENPGLVTFNEAYIFTSRPTASQHMDRATTLMHEMSHMWFGDLVTMKWWDDLWLKESFADFYGSKAVADATDLPGSWQSFAHQRKAWAYVQDSYPTTHPIVADIVDLEAARQNFDGITYAKGAAVIKQLFHWVGEPAFLQACRTYFQRFEFGTAQLADFLAVLEETSGQDLQSWAATWLKTSGPATLNAVVDEHGAVTVHQHGLDPLTQQHVLRSHALYVAVFRLNDQEQLVLDTEAEVVLSADETSVKIEGLTVDNTVPRLVLVNHHDQTYAKVELDDKSLEAVTAYPLIDASSTAVATVWSSLWTMVREASMSAAQFIGTVAQFQHDIADVSMHSRILEQAVIAVQEFAPAGQRERLTKTLTNALLDALVHLEHGADRQRSAARALARLGQGNEQLAPELTFLLASDETSDLSPGLQIDDELRWALLISLASVGRIDRIRLNEELERAHTATNELLYRTAVAALPDPVERTALWHQVFQGQDQDGNLLSNAALTATAQGLTCSPPHTAVEHLPLLLDGLQQIWGSRSNNLASRTINGLLSMRHDPVKGGPEAQQQHPVMRALDEWLRQHADAAPALRRIVIERRTDILLRLVAQASH